MNHIRSIANGKNGTHSKLSSTNSARSDMGGMDSTCAIASSIPSAANNSATAWKTLVPALSLAAVLLAALILCPSAMAYTMTVSSGCSYYTKASTAASAKAGTVTFGKDLDISKKGSTWSEFKVNGRTYFIKTKNLAYQYLVVTNYGQKMYAKASAKSTVKGYLATGTKLKYLGTVVKDGKSFEKVTATTYTGALCTKKKYSSAIGYVPSSATATYTAEKTITANTYLYASASSSAAKKPVQLGTEVKALCTGSTWTKAICNGETVYLYNSKLKNTTLQVLNAYSNMKRTADASSTSLKSVNWSVPVTIVNRFTIGDAAWVLASHSGTTGLMQYGNGTSIKLGCTGIKVLNDNCNAYKEPSTASSSVSEYKYYRPTMVRDLGNWKQMAFGSRILYIQSDNLEPLKYTVSGDYYASADKLRSNVRAGKASKLTVEVTDIDRSLGYMKVIIGGKARYMKTSSIVSDPAVTAKLYIANSGPKYYLFANTSYAEQGRLTFMTKVNYIGKALSVASGTYYALEKNGNVIYVFQKNGTADVFTSQKETFQYATSTAMQKQIVNNALDMVLNKKTRYSNAQRGTVSSTGVWAWDCSSFAGWLLDTAVRDYTGEQNWSVANKTTSWTSKYCKARKISRTQFCLYGTELYPTTTLWEFGDDVNDFDVSALEPGDLLFFRMAKSTPCPDHNLTYAEGDVCADHVAVYLGKGQFVHSTSRFDACVITPLLDDYTPEKCLVKAMRFLPTEEYLEWVRSLDPVDPDDEQFETMGMVDEPFNPNDSYFEGGE